MITNFQLNPKDISSFTPYFNRIAYFLSYFWKLHKFFPILIPVLRDFLQNQQDSMGTYQLITFNQHDTATPFIFSFDGLCYTIKSTIRIVLTSIKYFLPFFRLTDNNVPLPHLGHATDLFKIWFGITAFQESRNRQKLLPCGPYLITIRLPHTSTDFHLILHLQSLISASSFSGLIYCLIQIRIEVGHYCLPVNNTFFNLIQ